MKFSSRFVAGAVAASVTATAICQTADPLPNDFGQLRSVILHRDAVIRNTEVELARYKTLNERLHGDINALRNELAASKAENRKMSQELISRDIANAAAAAMEEWAENTENELETARAAIDELQQQIQERNILIAEQPSRLLYDNRVLSLLAKTYPGTQGQGYDITQVLRALEVDDARGKAEAAASSDEFASRKKGYLLLKMPSASHTVYVNNVPLKRDGQTYELIAIPMETHMYQYVRIQVDTSLVGEPRVANNRITEFDAYRFAQSSGR